MKHITLFLTLTFTASVFSWNLADLFPPTPQEQEQARIHKEKLAHSAQVLEAEFKKYNTHSSVDELYKGKNNDMHYDSDRIVYFLDFLLGAGHVCEIRNNSLFLGTEDLAYSPQDLLFEAARKNCPNVLNFLLAHGVPLGNNSLLSTAVCHMSERARFENKYKTALVLCAYGAERKERICDNTVSEHLKNEKSRFHSYFVEAEYGNPLGAQLRNKIAELIDSFDAIDQLKSLAKDPNIFISRLPADLHNEIEEYIVQSELPKKRRRE